MRYHLRHCDAKLLTSTQQRSARRDAPAAGIAVIKLPNVRLSPWATAPGDAAGGRASPTARTGWRAPRSPLLSEYPQKGPRDRWRVRTVSSTAESAGQVVWARRRRVSGGGATLPTEHGARRPGAMPTRASALWALNYAAVSAAMAVTPDRKPSGALPLHSAGSTHWLL